MSVSSAVIAALEEYEFDLEAGFARLGCALAIHRSNRLVCVIDEMEACCTWCAHNHKECNAIPSELKAMAQHYLNQVDYETIVTRKLQSTER